MGLGDAIRKLIGAAPQSDVDAASVAVRSAAEARKAATDARELVATARTEQERAIAVVVAQVEGELARLSARVEAMPEMRTQLESFVQSLGRTMTGAADRLEVVDDRMQRVEHESRAQTEILSLARAELDRQGRSVAAFEAQMKSLEEALARMAVASDRLESIVREAEQRRAGAGRHERIAIAAAVVGLIALVIAILR
jgi:chromosome segregation ATPase